jgi:hypothetical protein
MDDLRPLPESAGIHPFTTVACPVHIERADRRTARAGHRNGHDRALAAVGARPPLPRTPVGDEALADVPVVGGLWATLPATAAYVGGFCLAAAAAAGVPGLGEPSMVGSAEPSPGTPASGDSVP